MRFRDVGDSGPHLLEQLKLTLVRMDDSPAHQLIRSRLLDGPQSCRLRQGSRDLLGRVTRQRLILELGEGARAAVDRRLGLRCPRSIEVVAGGCGTSFTEVCFAVGCSSLGTFSSRFTDLVGMPPSVYRRQAARATAGMPSCVAKQVTRPIRNREAPAPEPQLA